MIQILIDKGWHKNRSVQIMVILFFAQVYLIFGQILPIYEEIPYYQNKISILKQHLTNLKVNKEHIAFYKSRINDMENRLVYYERELEAVSDMQQLQRQLHRIIQTHDLEVISQQIQKQTKIDDLKLHIILLSLKGEYPDLLSFLKDFNKISPFIQISKCEFINNETSALNPSIILNLSLTGYSPTNI